MLRFPLHWLKLESLRECVIVKRSVNDSTRLRAGRQGWASLSEHGLLWERETPSSLHLRRQGPGKTGGVDKI